MFTRFYAWTNVSILLARPQSSQCYMRPVRTGKMGSKKKIQTRLSLHESTDIFLFRGFHVNYETPRVRVNRLRILGFQHSNDDLHWYISTTFLYALALQGYILSFDSCADGLTQSKSNHGVEEFRFFTKIISYMKHIFRQNRLEIAPHRANFMTLNYKRNSHSTSYWTEKSLMRRRASNKNWFFHWYWLYTRRGPTHRPRRCLLRAIWIHAAPGTAWHDNRTNQILLPSAHKCRALNPPKWTWVPCHNIANAVSPTIPRDNIIQNPHQALCT